MNQGHKNFIRRKIGHELETEEEREAFFEGQKAAKETFGNFGELLREHVLGPRSLDKKHPLQLGYNELVARVAELEAMLSATTDIKAFAERCRPAARVWADRTERAVLNESLPSHYKPVLVAEAERAHRLLNEIDAMLKASPHDPPKVPGHKPVS